MSVEIWATIGTILGTVVLLVVPTLVFSWYALEQMIGDRRSYESVIAKCMDRKAEVTSSRPRAAGHASK
jgi:hypothetical protein